MVSRGEVAIIVATKGLTAGLVEKNLFSSVVVVVIITTLLAPFLLKLSFAKESKNGGQKEYQNAASNEDNPPII